MTKATPVSVEEAFSKLAFFADRTPRASLDVPNDAYFAELAQYRDGAIFITHFAGNSEWERHPNGDELVFVVEGEATLFLLVDGREHASPLRRGEFLVVPRNTWHRFEVAEGVKLMTVTPQPTDHSAELPD